MEKQRRGECQRGEEPKREDQRKSEKKENAGAQKKLEKSRNTVFFPMICGSGGSKSRLAKAAGAEPCGCTPLWREAHFQVKMHKTHDSRTTFGSWDVEKVHPVAARSTSPSQNVKNTTCLDHFWAFSCRFAWQAQGIVHCIKSEENVRVL